MAVVQAPSIADVLIASLNDLGRLKFTDLMSDKQNTIALKRIFKDKKTSVEDSGPEFQFNIITNTNSSAEHVGIGYVHQVDIPNILATGKMPFRHTKWAWAMERRLVAMNQGRAKIVDIAQTQRLAALGSAILLFERTLWRCPSLAEFDLHPVGLPYFVVKSATAATRANNNGFNGTVPSGYTLVADINPSTGANGRWKNYSDAYTAKTQDDLFTKMRRAQYYTDFMPLVDGMPTYEQGNDYGIYVNYETYKVVGDTLRAQNDNLGKDVSAMEGQGTFMRTPFTPVIQLDDDTTDPVYMINWGCLGAKVLKGEWMREEYFKAEARQPTVFQTVTDCTWNLFCTNRRRQAVLSNGTTMPD